MEGFDFLALLKKHEKKHKAKPTQFSSIAGGVTKRLQMNMRNRKSSRLSTFDKIRKLSDCSVHDIPSKPDLQQKVAYRRQQLERWKEEKEKQKKEAAAHKKKPFVAGVPHAPLNFVPPPPPVPSTSGRVTRSQTSRINASKSKVNTKEPKTQSFAPKNASFKPPQIKNLPKVPPLAKVTSKSRTKTKNFTFDPVIPSEVKHSRSNKKTKEAITKVESKISSRKASKSPKPHKLVSIVKQSSSSSSEDQHHHLTSSGSSSEGQHTLHSSTETDWSEKSPPTTRKSICSNNSPILGNKTPRKSIGSEKFTPKRTIPKSESSSEERLRSPKSPVEVPMTPEQISEEAKKISPCVTMSRGKDNARKEMKKKIDEGLLDEDASDMYSISHFRKQLDSEIKRITEMCDTWDRVSAQTVLPEAVQEAVLGAVGQARLLMSQKLQQFSSLVDRCERPEAGVALVTPADLHGFWDMVFMQVENVDMRFKKLEELRERGWVEEQPLQVKRKPGKLVARPVKPAAPSRIKDMIAAARKAKKQQEQEPQPSLQPAAADGSKTFEAGFFCVRSPVRSPPPASPRRPPSLLRAVLASEATKASACKSSASFAMLRASLLGKNMECDGIAPLPPSPITPVNLYATPGRSILKSTNGKSGKKSIKVVLFDQSEHDTDSTEAKDDIHDGNIDSGLSSMDIEKDVDSDKENSRRKSKLTRQDATEERSPVMTRSRRKSIQTPVEQSETSYSRKKTLHETDNVIQTPKRSSRRRKSRLQTVE